MKFSIFSSLLVANGVFAAPSITPVNSRPTAGAKKLLNYLVDQSASGNTLSGQQDLESAQWISQNIGRWPAILGVDFMDYSPSRVAFGSSSRTVEDAISYYNSGGIITFCWHWGSPSGTINSGSQPWWSNFYTDATTFDVAAAMNNQNPNDYRLIIRDIDAIAVQLKRLQSANIPVLWRPLHEAEGGWFWWGAKGPDACKRLYRLMYDRLTNYHGLNNLIWVWNSVEPSWYPGNDVVDVVSADVYSSAGDHSSQRSLYQRLQNLSGNTKLIALGEVGNIPDPINTRRDGANWAWWVTWNGNFIKSDQYNPLQYKYNIFSSQYILTRDEAGGARA